MHVLQYALACLISPAPCIGPTIQLFWTAQLTLYCKYAAVCLSLPRLRCTSLHQINSTPMLCPDDLVGVEGCLTIDTACQFD